MIIGCIGDVHGRACHALSILLKWQAMRKKPFDLVVQVGDLGVMPLPDTGEIPYDRFSQWDPSVYDLCDIINAEGSDAQLIKDIRAQLSFPILVVAGNHDEFAHIQHNANPSPLDPHDLFMHVPHGFKVEIESETIGFCEGENPTAFQNNDPKKLDVLVSHEGGFGEDAEKDNLSAGPSAIQDYLRTSKPRYHIFGHFHHPVGPRMVYETACIQLASVVSNPRDPTLQVVNEGCIGALDTETNAFEFVSGDWLSAYQRKGGRPLLAKTMTHLGEHQ